MPLNISELVTAAASSHPDTVALSEPRSARRITWAQFDDDVDTVASVLAASGLRAGQRVMLLLGNGIDMATAWFGVLRCGLVAVPVSPRSTASELSDAVRSFGPRVIVADSDTISTVRQVDTAEALVLVHRAAVEKTELRFDDVAQQIGRAEPVSPHDPEALAAIVLTSGATKSSRGVMLSHRALLAAVENTLAIDPSEVGDDERVLICQPMSRILGLNVLLGSVARRAASAIMIDSSDPLIALEAIAAERVTIVPANEAMMTAWLGVPDLAQRMSSVREVFVNGRLHDAQMAARFSELTDTRIVQGYGMTETGGIITVSEPSSHPEAWSVGRPLPGVEIALRDELGQLSAGEDPATIWVRSTSLFSGYWPDGTGGADTEGWYPTGDLGQYDAEGNLVIVDPARATIKVSGFTVYPSEVEGVLARLTGISEVVVVAFGPSEDPHVGACLVPANAEADADELIDSARSHAERELARFKQPARYLVTAKLPATAAGVVARREVSNLFTEEAER